MAQKRPKPEEIVTKCDVLRMTELLLGVNPIRYTLVRRDRPNRAEKRARLHPGYAAYQEPFLKLIFYGSGFVEDGADTSGDVNFHDVTGNIIVFEVYREMVEDFHRNEPYTLEDMFEFAIIEPIWQRMPDPNV